MFFQNEKFSNPFSIKFGLNTFILAPVAGWFADVKFGRYNVINFASFVIFFASIFLFLGIITSGVALASTLLLASGSLLVYIGLACYPIAMLPFISDQIIGATSDELSAVICWYYWADELGDAVSDICTFLYVLPSSITVELAVIFAVPLAVIIISDCLCQQWLDKTHKVTNPIKLIIQVLNYTRKHRYPERRSAFTYIDEEQPTRMDYGKRKFGGPFTEEEVEDVKTVLRLLPIVICLHLSLGYLSDTPMLNIFTENGSYADSLIGDGFEDWLIPLLLIPFYQLAMRRCRFGCNPSMLTCIGAGMFVFIVCFISLTASALYGVIVSDDVQRYLTCLAANGTAPDSYVEWYWKVGLIVFYRIGYTISGILLNVIIIAQSPDKMKGLVFGIIQATGGIVDFACYYLVDFTLCSDVIKSLSLVVLFVVFLVLSKRYRLRERNREINIQAIVEEHYERYMDQEEEYMRENPQYYGSLNYDSDRSQS